MSSIRAEQLAADIQKELSELIQKKVRDPRVGFVTVTRVRVTDDLSFARVYISDLAAKDTESKSMEGLQKATGFLRSALGKALRIRHIPELRFMEDDSMEYSEHMSELLDSINREQSSEDDDRMTPEHDEDDS